MEIDPKLAIKIEWNVAQQMSDIEQDAIKKQKELDAEQQQERDGS